MTVVGTETLDLIIDLCFPENPENTPIATIEKVVDKHLSPKRSVITERMIFRSCKQTEEQSKTFTTHSLKKSKSCKFATNEILKEILRDQFVYGLFSERTRQ